MSIINLFQEKKDVKLIVISFLCVFMMICNSFSVYADIIPSENVSRSSASERALIQNTENITQITSEQSSEQEIQASEPATNVVTDMFSADNYQLITVTFIFVIVFILLLKFIL